MNEQKIQTTNVPQTPKPVSLCPIDTYQLVNMGFNKVLMRHDHVKVKFLSKCSKLA